MGARVRGGRLGRGVIAKRRDSVYEHRRFPKIWLKMKCEASQELVVGGCIVSRVRVGLGALLVGYFDADDFVFAGKVGTGFDTEDLLGWSREARSHRVGNDRSRRQRGCRVCARTG